jgi:hypothetical protein
MNTYNLDTLRSLGFKEVEVGCERDISSLTEEELLEVNTNPVMAAKLKKIPGTGKKVTIYKIPATKASKYIHAIQFLQQSSNSSFSELEKITSELRTFASVEISPGVINMLTDALIDTHFNVLSLIELEQEIQLFNFGFFPKGKA